MPDYAQNLQNPDYAPNYAIMPGHNGEDPRLAHRSSERLTRLSQRPWMDLDTSRALFASVSQPLKNCLRPRKQTRGSVLTEGHGEFVLP